MSARLELPLLVDLKRVVSGRNSCIIISFSRVSFHYVRAVIEVGIYCSEYGERTVCSPFVAVCLVPCIRVTNKSALNDVLYKDNAMMARLAWNF